MDTPIPAPASDEDARAARKRWEADRIAAARRQAEAGLTISGDELARWLALYESTDGPEPIPLPRRAT